MASEHLYHTVHLRDRWRIPRMIKHLTLDKCVSTKRLTRILKLYIERVAWTSAYTETGCMLSQVWHE
jgi:hypothetical protein